MHCYLFVKCKTPGCPSKALSSSRRGSDRRADFVEYVLTDGSPEAQHMAAELERIHALEDAR